MASIGKPKVMIPAQLHIGLTGLLLLLGTTVAHAQSNPDCTDPQTQMAMNFCAEQDYLAADADLNTAYGKAMAAMKEIDSYLEPDQRGAADSLRDAQRAWIPFRDKACEAEGYMVSGGSMQPMIIYGCRQRLTRQRIGDLQVLIDGMGN